MFIEDGAFDPEYIDKSLGRIYRQWKKTRKRFDPDFDPAAYRHPRET